MRTEKGEKMIIAVTYENGDVFQHFGHTEQFKVYEVEEGRILSSRVIGSEGQGHGALADLLSGKGIDVLICGGIGGGAQTALTERGIELCAGASGSADEAVEAYLRGELVNTGANCDHHGADHSCADHNDGGRSEDSGQEEAGEQPAPKFEGKNTGKKVVTHYVGTLDDGSQFDSSYDRGEPLEFICGSGTMIPGYDSVVANMEIGDIIDVHLTPEQAYGEVDPQAIFTVEIENMPGAEKFSAGDRAYLRNPQGRAFPVIITAKDDKTITFDANHELAGKELNFHIELIDVLDPDETPEGSR